MTTRLRQNSLREVQPALLLTGEKETMDIHILTITAVKKMSIEVLAEESNHGRSEHKSQRCRRRGHGWPETQTLLVVKVRTQFGADDLNLWK